MDGDTGRVDLRTGQCPASGDYRVDLYLGGVLQASAEVTATAAGAGRRRRASLASFHVCRPETWTVVTRGPSLLDVRSPGDAQRMTVRVFPASPEATRAGAASALATLADRLAARRRFQPACCQASAVDDQRGTLRAYRQAGEHDRALLTWVSLGRDDVLRTVVLEGAPGDRPLFDRLLSRVGFADLEG